MLTTINEPNSSFSLYNDYYFEYHSSVNEKVNFNYIYTYQELKGLTWSDVQSFDRFANPIGNLKITLRDYLSTKFESDYFQTHFPLVGIYDTAIVKSFKLKIQESFAYQFPFVNLNSSGVEIGTGVTKNSTKINGLYDVKLTYSKTGGSSITPIFTVGSVVEIIDGSDPSVIDPTKGLSGIWTILEVGIDYVIINATYDSTHTYYSGSVLWSDRRRIIDASTQYISSPFTFINNVSVTRNIQTAAPTYYQLRSGTKISIPILNIPADSQINIYVDGVLVDTYFPSQTNIQLDYVVPVGSLLTIEVYNGGTDTYYDTFNFSILDKCESWIKKTTLYFLDNQGAFIPFYFDLIKTRNVEITNKNYKTIDETGRTYKYQSDTIKVVKYELNTDFLDEATSLYFEQLLECPYVYVDFDNVHTIQKCLIVDKSQSIITKNNKRMIQYKLNIELSKTEFRQK